MAKIQAAEEEEAIKKEQKDANDAMRIAAEQAAEYKRTHDYFDGNAWTSDMPESIINQRPGKLNYAYS